MYRSTLYKKCIDIAVHSDVEASSYPPSHCKGSALTTLDGRTESPKSLPKPRLEVPSDKPYLLCFKHFPFKHIGDAIPHYLQATCTVDMRPTASL